MMVPLAPEGAFDVNNLVRYGLFVHQGTLDSLERCISMEWISVLRESNALRILRYLCLASRL